ncbi:tail fiber assembly protein [Escherichia coli]
MKPEFDNNGLANKAGNIRVYYYDPESKEYIGWSDEYINIGVSMPGDSTDIDPGDDVVGMVAVFDGEGWEQREDHRGELVYSTADGNAVTVDYIGDIREGFTTTAPATQYDTWNGSEWVTDAAAQHAADVAVAEQQRERLINAALQSISVLQLKLQAGRTLTESENNKLSTTLDYIDAVNATDIGTAPDISWPEPPVV